MTVVPDLLGDPLAADRVSVALLLTVRLAPERVHVPVPREWDIETVLEVVGVAFVSELVGVRLPPVGLLVGLAVRLPVDLLFDVVSVALVGLGDAVCDAGSVVGVRVRSGGLIRIVAVPVLVVPVPEDVCSFVAEALAVKVPASHIVANVRGSKMDDGLNCGVTVNALPPSKRAIVVVCP